MIWRHEPLSKKQDVLNEIRKSGGAYVVIGNRLHSVDLGYTTKVKDLYSGVAAFAAQHGVSEVQVSTGRNIMNVDGPSAKFSVTVKVS